MVPAAYIKQFVGNVWWGDQVLFLDDGPQVLVSLVAAIQAPRKVIGGTLQMLQVEQEGLFYIVQITGTKETTLERAAF